MNRKIELTHVFNQTPDEVRAAFVRSLPTAVEQTANIWDPGWTPLGRSTEMTVLIDSPSRLLFLWVNPWNAAPSRVEVLFTAETERASRLTIFETPRGSQVSDFEVHASRAGFELIQERIAQLVGGPGDQRVIERQGLALVPPEEVLAWLTADSLDVSPDGLRFFWPRDRRGFVPPGAVGSITLWGTGGVEINFVGHMIAALPELIWFTLHTPDLDPLFSEVRVELERERGFTQYHITHSAIGRGARWDNHFQWSEQLWDRFLRATATLGVLSPNKADASRILH